jgi:hypothetical protein
VAELVGINQPTISAESVQNDPKRSFGPPAQRARIGVRRRRSIFRRIVAASEHTPLAPAQEKGPGVSQTWRSIGIAAVPRRGSIKTSRN